MFVIGPCAAFDRCNRIFLYNVTNTVLYGRTINAISIRLLNGNIPSDKQVHKINYFAFLVTAEVG